MNEPEGKPRLAQVVEPSFQSLVSSIYSAIMLNLGQLKVKGAGEIGENIEMSRFNLKLLEMLGEKTKGNLNQEEEIFLKNLITAAKIKLNEKA